MVWLETPTNPTLKIIDIKAVCELTKKKNTNIITIVDNTFASAYFQVLTKINLKLTLINQKSKGFFLNIESIGFRC